ncbi:MAG: hypothetical protein APF81_08360 [Desulfosporosinus sp. BRH_c37]|nr:MAG: hypothetical protein APF81_08360 [Desulfosporosinus sp. BRH_c37]
MARKKPAPKHEAPKLYDYRTAADPKAWADEIPVFCAHDAIIMTSDLKPNPKNPNQHPLEQVKLLGAIIRAQGWRGPITISNRSGLIVRGHGRLMAAQLEELIEVPVDYQNYSSDAEEMADLVADNRIAELSDADAKMLAEVFADINTGEIPFTLSGYSEEEYSDIVNALAEALQDQTKDPETATEPDKPITKNGDLWILGKHRVICGDCSIPEDRDRLFDGAESKILPELIEKLLVGGAGTTLVSYDSVKEVAYIMELTPESTDIIVKRFIRAIGDEEIRCIRKGKELPFEAIQGMFGTGVEGGERQDE